LTSSGVSPFLDMFLPPYLFLIAQIRSWFIMR
jgi:hypothetical protein